MKKRGYREEMTSLRDLCKYSFELDSFEGGLGGSGSMPCVMETVVRRDAGGWEKVEKSSMESRRKRADEDKLELATPTISLQKGERRENGMDKDP